MLLQLPRRTLPLDAPVVMGILNVTPDSFSDGGRHRTVEAALRRAGEMIGEGAGIVDVGGESTRPGSEAVGESEEIDRVVPVIEAIRREFDVAISIDTMKPAVMRAACAAGAELINDVYALQAPGALDAAREAGAAVCLMHMQGQPKTMQRAPHYDDVLAEVRGFLAERVAACERAGIPRSRLCIDPGIGFGKRLEHNLALLAQADALAAGLPVLIGVSRKAMFGELLGRPVDERLPGALAVAAIAVWQGAAIVRVHDVKATADAIRVAQALREFRKTK
ncbi:dihydropteroate synthase [Solimonas variicoloris]|uniref:dihydropteroate synthase n=1 Tax=Solimonas variicoloris TaxID=254408 RepID=UPI00039A9A36|nr:dihydropteroate synthase [Solimonas variicoloris]